MLYGVRSVEPLVLAGAPLILFAASLLASFIRRFAPPESTQPSRSGPNRDFACRARHLSFVGAVFAPD
jgi:hypothetical protein